VTGTSRQSLYKKMSFKETIDSIKEAVQERISSPILGSFAFFVFGFNWQTLVIVWKTQLPIEVALQNLETTRITWWRGLIWPSICTLVFCLAYPWFKFWLSTYTDKIDTKRVIKRHAIDVQILKNQKAIVTAQGELDEIKEKRLQDAERKKRQFEFELEQKANEFDLNAARYRQSQQMELESSKKFKELELERDLKAQRKKWHMDDPNS
jgi:hypothetical protein